MFCGRLDRRNRIGAFTGAKTRQQHTDPDSCQLCAIEQFTRRQSMSQFIFDVTAYDTLVDQTLKHKRKIMCLTECMRIANNDAALGHYLSY